MRESEQSERERECVREIMGNNTVHPSEREREKERERARETFVYSTPVRLLLRNKALDPELEETPTTESQETLTTKYSPAVPPFRGQQSDTRTSTAQSPPGAFLPEIRSTGITRN